MNNVVLIYRYIRRYSTLNTFFAIKKVSKGPGVFFEEGGEIFFLGE